MLLKRKGSTNWYYKFEIGGKTVFRSTGTEDKDLAKEIEAKAQLAHFKIIKMGEKPRYLWQEAVIRFIAENQHKKSLETDKQHFRWLAKHLDGKYLDEINQKTIEDIIAAKLKETGTARVNRTTAAISAVLNKAARQWEWIDKAPSIRKFKETGKRLRWLTHEEADRLLLELNGHTKAMVEFSLATGLRHANVTGLEWGQIDMTAKILWIYPDQAKAGKAIRVPLNENALSVLRGQRLIRSQYGIYDA